ncbi:Xaa-Pro aminopeptidase 1 [Armadillidium nasatum]|uniref:Xaa-Pro aminopeptidase 1 n=1 Tax=Armadillidium nasatum TaxID=96803 RepID=A0A5N5SY00_9CRUS|nr:Xaa-Pro aminopeptidase 1 [Armadillidium nasatum]
MKTENVDAYIIPTSDEHLSEYVSKFDERRVFITGFKGSAGTAVVLSDGTRALWTDGRYFLQADQELDCNWLLMKESVDGVPTIPEWLKDKLQPNSVVGADPKLISAMEWLEYEKDFQESQITMRGIAKNLVDELRPGREEIEGPEIPIQILELQFAGKKWEEKVADVRKELEKQQADMIVITAMDENAWLFNLRGGDVPHNPGTLNALASLDSVKKVILPSKYSYSGGANYAIYSAIKAGNSWNEISAADRLEKFRAEQEYYHSLSFDTISAFGSNGAIIHYSPSPETNKEITNQSLYLLDSGGQYKDGTTDVTRTLHYGTPTKFQKEAYTRVLKGAINLALLTFPKGTKDTRVDIVARSSLYEVGLDYRHGTGHGIGMFLNIHEAPTQMRIYGTEEHELKEGYFFSDVQVH